MWITRDGVHGYRVWFIKPVIKPVLRDVVKIATTDVFCHQGILPVEPPHPVSLNYFDEPENGRMIEDIFVKLGGGELGAGECINVNLKEVI
tara:strand:- start:219 stop:491 length:273 start_codon:yes stop_codon:yes gene_type:complete